MKKLFTFLVLFLSSIGLFAQVDVTVGTGTIVNSSSGYPAPYGNWYWGARHQFLIPASEIISSGGFAGTITSLGFNVSTVQGTALTGFEVRIGTTTATDLTSWQSGLTTVYTSTSYTEVSGWNMHAFSTPFTWNGTDNIIVETCFNNTGYTNNAGVFQSTTTYNSSYVYRADAAGVCTNAGVSTGSFTPTQRPNIKFAMVPITVANDAGVVSINSPTLPAAPGTHTVSATITTMSTSLTSATVNWSVNGVSQTPFSWTGTLSQFQTAGPLTLGTFNFPAGFNTIKVWTSAPNNAVDSFNSNDTVQVTMNFVPTLSGAYTIGGAGADFPDMRAALEAMTLGGLSGPVVFNCVPNTGPFTGGFEFGVIPGISSINTVTFKGNLNTIKDTTASYLIAFNGAKYITLDSFNITNTVPANAKFGIAIRGASQYLNITNSVIDMGITSTSSLSAGIIVSGSATSATTAGNNAQYLNISNNTIIGGYYGITLVGASSYLNNYGHIVANNIIKDFYYYGLYMVNADTIVIKDNEIRRDGRSTITTFYGLYMSTCRNTKVLRNEIHSSGVGSYTAYPLYLTTSVNTLGYETEFINNAIYNIPSTSTIYGMYLLGTRDYVNIYYNTVNLVTTAANTVRNMFISTAPNNHNHKNNLYSLSGTGTGAKYCIYITSTSTSFYSDYNNYHMGATAGTNNMGYWTANRATLNDWQTATMQDAASISVDPAFTSVNTFRTTAIGIWQAGTPITGVTDDIDGDTRHITTPCIGADEFILYSNDAGIIAMTEPMAVCAGIANVKAVVKNYGIIAMNSVNVNWSVNGVAQTPVAYTTTIAAGATDTVTLGSYTFASGVAYNLKFWTSSPNAVSDQLPANDTLNVIGFKTSFSGTYTVGPLTTDNYPTMAALVADLNAYGVCGPVTINVAAGSGPYTGGFEFGNIAGTSDLNTIVINGNNTVINQGSVPIIIAFNGTKYLTLKNFRIINTIPANAYFGIHIRGGARYLNIDSNLIDLGIASTSSLMGGIIVSGSTTSATTAGDNGKNLTITNNEIIGGYYGITLVGVSSYLNGFGHNVSNNTVKDFYYYGLYMANVDTATVLNNEFNRATRTTITTFYGVYMTTCRNVKLIGNRIHSSGAGSYGAYPFYITTSVNTMGYETELINNVVYNIPTTSTLYGIYLLGTRDYINLYHNTVSLEALSTNTVYAVFFSGAPNNHKFRNNIVSLTGGTAATGTKYLVYVSTTSTSFVSDNNVYYINALAGTTNNLGYWSAARNTLLDWQTATLQDANSVVGNPVFASVVNHDLKPLSAAVDNTGAPVGVLTDIAGLSRSTTTPDAGAHEFTGIPSDLGVSGGKLANGQCLSTNDTIFVTLTNLIGAAVDLSVDPQTIVYMITGPVNSSDSIVANSGIVPMGGNLEVSKLGVNLSQPGVYFLSVYIKPSSKNAYQGNDTLWNFYTHTIYIPFEVTPKNVVVTNVADTVVLTAKSTFFPGGAFSFTEVCQFKGAVTGWPAWLIADDYIEIVGVPNSDLGGYTLEQWSGTTLSSSHTFPAGTLMSPQGTAIIAVGEMGSSVPSPTNFYYHGNGAYSSSWGSSTASGRIIKDLNGGIVDAVGYYGYTFPAAANVPASEWSNSNTGGGSTAGIRRTSADDNTGACWIVTSGSTIVQDPNVVNAGVTVPTPTSLTGFAWNHNGVVTSTMPDTVVGPFTTNGLYKYIATYVTPCGTFTDSVTIIAMVEPISGSGDTTICSGDSVQLFVNLPGIGPWTIVVNDGTLNDTIAGITTTPWQKMVYPLDTTTYTVVSYWDANNYPVPGNVSSTVNVLPTPVVTLAALNDLCIDVTPFALTGGLPAGGTYTGTGVATGSFDPMAAGPGTHTITYTYIETGGCSAFATESITVNALPVINLPVVGPLCLTDASVTLAATPAGGTYAGTGITAGVFDPAIAGTGYHVYTYSFTDTATTCSNMGTDSILVNPNPTVTITGTPDTLCYTHWVTINATAGMGAYLWSTGDVTPSIDLIGSILGIGTHVITVTVTNSFGCTDTESVSIVVEHCTDVEGISNNIRMNIYPNPTTGIFTLSISGMQKTAGIEVLNILGQTVYSETAILKGSFVKEFDLSQLPKGYYLLKVTTDTHVRTERIIVR